MNIASLRHFAIPLLLASSMSLTCLPAAAETPAMARTAEDFTRALSAPINPPAHLRLRGKPIQTLNTRGPRPVLADDPAPTTIVAATQPVMTAPVVNQAPPQTSGYDALPLTQQALPKATAMVHFDFNSATLRADAYQVLNELAQALRSSLTDAVLMIVGHTDSQGRESYNLWLSEQRAQAVKEYLVRSGIAAGRLVVRGLGEMNPIASNANDSGRAVNRRTEFIRVGSL